MVMLTFLIVLGLQLRRYKWCKYFKTWGSPGKLPFVIRAKALSSARRLWVRRRFQVITPSKIEAEVKRENEMAGVIL
jgi:hypothetical protein